jgi:hypothetical protein
MTTPAPDLTTFFSRSRATSSPPRCVWDGRSWHDVLEVTEHGYVVPSTGPHPTEVIGYDWVQQVIE